METFFKILALILLIIHGGFQLNAQTYDLDDCIKIALIQNPTMKDAAIAAERASAERSGAVSNFLPNLQVSLFQSGNFGRSIDRFTNSYINEFYNSTYAGGNFELPLFNAFSNRYALQSSDKSVASAELLNQGAKNQLALQVTSAYLEVLAGKEMINAVRSLIQGDSTRLIDINAKLDAGLATRTEQLTIINQLKTDELSLLDAQMSFDASVIRLFRLLNQEVPVNPIFEDVNFSIDNFEASGLQQKLLQLPEVRRFDLQAESQQFSAKSIMAQKYPRIRLLADYGSFYASSNPERNFGQQLNDTRNGSISIGVSWSILSFHRIKSNTRIALANAESTLNEKEKYLNTLKTDIDVAMSRYQALTKKYDQASQLEELSQEAVDNINLQLNSGTIGMSDFLLARNNLERARTNKIRAKYELLLQQKVLQYYGGGQDKLR